MKHKATAIAALIAGLALAGCGDEVQPQPQPDQAPPAQAPARGAIDFQASTQTAQNADLNEKLLQAIRERQKLGGQIMASPVMVFLNVERGGVGTETVRLTNSGDEEVTITNAVVTSQQNGVTISGCAQGTVVKIGAFCDLILSYTDTTGRNLDTQILISTNSRRSSQITIPVQIGLIVPEEPAPAPAPAPAPKTDAKPEPVRQSYTPAEPAAPAYDPAVVAAMNEARQLRAASGFGRPDSSAFGRPNSFHGSPKVVMRDREKRYDPELYPWTESSLPVDRTRILTADRVIKAVIETPILGGLCRQVVAVVESNVFSPDHDNVLIPAGSRAIGQCAEGMDERQDVVWQRIITPDGVSIRFKSDPRSADATGLAGVPGIVRESFSDRYIMPLVTTSINAFGAIATAMWGEGTTTTTSGSNPNGNYSSSTSVETPRDKALEQLNGPVRDTINKYIEDNRDLRRVYVVPGGTRVDIVLSEDLYFKNPYEVVRLADVEYEIRRSETPPYIVENMPPYYGMDPTLGRPGGPGGPLVTIDGRNYRLVPAQSGGDEAGLGAGAGPSGGSGGYASPYASGAPNPGVPAATASPGLAQPFYGAFKPYGPLDAPPGQAAYAQQQGQITLQQRPSATQGSRPQ